jgi:ATPase family associated with various cellular activities (AAA)/Ankyrin repeats (many copies)
LHAACSFQATADVVEALLVAFPGGASQPNAAGNLPIHQAAMWQSPVETVELLLARYPEGATVRNQYGSLPLHMAASNQASQDVIRILINAYPDALHLQNDDGMTPLDLALADESASDAVLALLEGRPPPPELTRRQKAEKYEERAAALERKLATIRDSGGRQDKDLSHALAAVRRLADRFPHALYAAGMDPNELEIAFSDQIDQSRGAGAKEEDAERILMDAIRKRTTTVVRDARGNPMMTPNGTAKVETPLTSAGPRDRVEDLLSSIVGLEHIKSQVRGLRRTAEISDLRESLVPIGRPPRGGGPMSLVAPALAEDLGRPCASHMVFAGNPGTGKTAVARLLAKVFHELGILRKPKFLEVERMDLVARDKETTIIKTREVIDEARGGVLFIDEANLLGMASKKNRLDTGVDAMGEIMRGIDAAAKNKADDSFPLIILAGFPLEIQAFLAFQPEMRKRFPLLFEFPDYSCLQLARIFMDLAIAKGFDFDDDVTESMIAQLLEQETTTTWRSERTGRVSEMLLTGVRGEVRKRMRRAQLEEHDDFDPHLLVRADIENVMRTDFK